MRGILTNEETPNKQINPGLESNPSTSLSAHLLSWVGQGWRGLEELERRAAMRFEFRPWLVGEIRGDGGSGDNEDSICLISVSWSFHSICGEVPVLQTISRPQMRCQWILVYRLSSLRFLQVERHQRKFTCPQAQGKAELTRTTTKTGAGGGTLFFEKNVFCRKPQKMS